MRRFRASVTDGQSLAVSTAAYIAGEKRASEALWDTGHVIVDADSDYTIHGWVCGQPGYLYHCYIPPELRRCGIARALIDEKCGKEEVQIARPWPYKTMPRNWVYNPYIL